MDYRHADNPTPFSKYQKQKKTELPEMGRDDSIPLPDPPRMLVRMNQGIVDGVYSDNEAIIGMEVIFTEEADEAGVDPDNPGEDETILEGDRVVYTSERVVYKPTHELDEELKPVEP